MKNYMKKMVMTMAVCAMSVTAFAAEPVFDSPQEEAAFCAQQKQAAAWEEAHGNYNITRENPVYFVTANPFDNPQEEAAFWAQQKEQAAWEEAHGNYNISRENPVYFVIAPAFDSPQEEYDFYHK